MTRKSTSMDGQMALPIVPPSRHPELAGHIRAGWQNDAACGSDRSNLFDAQVLTDPQRVADAKYVCLSCPVRDSCRATALLADEEGIWGGLTPAERDHLRSRLSDGLGVRQALDWHYLPDPRTRRGAA